ncbi:MAG TPA: phosphoribosylamine--glycine ligase [Dermatophilaceae bacterium]|nr:phosphoribosylamine--glycine ligase [Dermatophilaceae bacterium]HOA57905.1 phosphoribosylamine--glycine ligase [Dermatophilaceae bacterium]HOF36217.1 phosphoribosylamine--glycine ligase [Dermatophilaceae bacterium]HPV78764.1 phosphoribosylamine--glycine ligase [Dermatophilaceae bacterium]HPZ68637.1 phosphoribosylamine--glycine ligase [Dermatophilaceae bacterium]
MKVLVIGSGAREHALVRGLSADPDVSAVVAAPGNPGIDLIAQCEPLADVCDAAAVLAVAARHTVDLVVVGPEAPLVAGVSDALREAGYAVYGPSAAAAQLEGSKSFAKEVMASAGVPTALAHVCTTMAEVESALDALGAPHVVKDDGLAAGKGVVVTDDREAALAHARACLAKPDGQLVVEEFLDGPEVSVFCICDGTSVRALSPAQDFKRVGDGDLGPNTGGMGAYSPLPWAPPHLSDWVIEHIAQPTIDEMHRRGTPFVGTLYVGLAMTSRGPRVVEFNARFGDPDGQVSLARLVTPLGTLLYAAATGRLDDADDLHHRPESAVVVVLAAEGYPAAPVPGGTIEGLDAAAEVPGAWVLHAGTRRAEDGRIVAAGGRVLDVMAVGADLASARDTAYRAVSCLELAGGHHRSDIALAAARGEIHIPGSDT